MIFNDESFEVNVEANYGHFIEISNKSKNKKFTLSFAPDYKDYRKFKINEKVFVTDDFHWDPTIEDEDGYIVLDTSDINIYLTRLEDNLFLLELGIKNPYVIFSTPENRKLEYFGINVKISFNYDYKPTPDYEILTRGTIMHTHEELMDVLDRM